MHGIPEGRSEAEVGEGDSIAPPEQPPFELDGRDILARACMAALVQGQRRIGSDEEFDFSTAVFDALKSVTGHDIGPHSPSSWLCINLDDYRVGRAYPYKGEHRIVAMSADEDLLQDIEYTISPEEEDK